MAAEAGGPPRISTISPSAVPRLYRGAVVKHGLDWDRIDALLHTLEPTPQNLQLFQDGAVDPASYVERSGELGMARPRLIKERFYGLLRSGAALVFNRMELHSLEARQLCAAVSRLGGASGIGNGYLSFGGKCAFDKHWDTHDVYAVQLIGRKRWQLFQPTFMNPLAEHTSEAMAMQCPDKVMLDCVLSPGDMLYVPRGWWHQTLPFDEPSFHLSVGLYPPTLHDFLGWALSRVAPQRLAVRQTLSTDPGVAAGDLGAAVEALRDLLLDPSVLADYRRELALADRPLPEFELARFAGEQNIGPETLLRLATAQAAVRTPEALLINGRALPVDGLGARIIQLLATVPMCTFAALSDALIDVPEALLQEGVFELAAHGCIVTGGVQLAEP